MKHIIIWPELTRSLQVPDKTKVHCNGLWIYVTLYSYYLELSNIKRHSLLFLVSTCIKKIKNLEWEGPSLWETMINIEKHTVLTFKEIITNNKILIINKMYGENQFFL
jgi:hypothetical protein